MVQADACRRYALDQNLGPVADYTDDALSGKSGVHRPEFERLKADIGRGIVKSVVCYRSDRLSRDTLDMLVFNRLITQHGVSSHSVSEGGRIDLDTAAGRMQAGIRGIFGAYEREQTAERVVAKQRYQAQQGMVAPGRYRLYGYADKKREEIDPAEAKVVVQLAHDFLRGLPLYALAVDLNSRGIPKRSGATWEPKDIRRLLLNPAYTGLRSFQGEIVAEGKWPKIIERDLWDRLQLELKRRKGRQRITKASHLLSGLLYCANCHTKLAAGKNGKYESYICPTPKGCGKVSRSRKPINDTIEMLTMLQIRRLPIMPKAADRTELDKIESDIELLSEARKANRIDMVTFLDQNEALQKQRSKLAVVLANDVMLSTLSGRAGQFQRSPMDEKRETIRRFFPAIGIKPAGRGVKFNIKQLELPEPVGYCRVEAI
ncbi:recombinase family protein [Rhodococcus sp. H36-A4]|uniref:recombinase family protein n=1 Tax=Rhodococcus sp. H36-A4 TaxID=3004353 RepID=UPI0022B074FD|nr:recombinase family protein [Rhodococcus sp. H36-A4]MCZ4078634.1 recombinase family protein [Rhodococcus sp. H36-A4]